MPSRTPTLEDVQLPNIGGPRPVAGIDVSGYGRGAQALARSGEVLGQDIQKSASEIAETTMYQQRNNALLAQDKILGGAIGLREKYKHDTDYTTLQDRYNTDLNTLVEDGLKDLKPGSPLYNHVSARLQIPLAHERSSIEEQAFAGKRQDAHADLYNRGTDLIESTDANFNNDPLQANRVQTYNQIADNYVANGLMTPLEAAQHKQRLWTGIADAEARARIEQGPAEAAKVEQELRKSVGGGRSMFPAVGRGASNAASVISRAETGDASIGPKALGNISPDSNGSKSYGFLGLNSGTGSAGTFARRYGSQFGLTANPGSVAFDQQWRAAASTQTEAFRAAQLRYFNENILPSVASDLQKYGVPANIASDPRVQTYFADRAVQMGNLAMGNIEPAWRGSGGDVTKFLQNMNVIDGTPQQLRANFHSAIASGVYGPEGHAERLRTRLAGALASTGDSGMPGVPERPYIEGEGNPLFSKLTPQHRDALIAHAQATQHKFRTDAYTQLQSNVKDDLAAAARDGYVPQGRSLDEFKAIYGDQAEPVFRDYNQQLQLATDMHNMRDMSPEDRQAIIAAHAPTPGEPGYAVKAQRQDNLIKLDAEITKAANASALKEREAAIKDLGERAKGVALEAASSGKVTKGIGREEFISTLGEEQGAAAWNAYTNATQYGVDLYHLGEKTPEEKLGVVSSYEPRPGQDNVEQQLQRHNELLSAANGLHKQLTDDPAGYMLRNSPVVRDAWTKFSNATNTDDQTTAAQDFAAKTISEQKRFGVDPADIKVVPDNYAEDFKSRVEAMALAGNGNQVQATIKAEQEKWGDAWPQVYRQVTDGDPMLRVVGAGVKSSAGQLLTNNSKVKFADIVKDEQSAKAKDITENVDTSMAPFASSLIGNAGGIRLYNDVRGQIEKLAAIYSFQNGMSAPDAAKQATADVLDFKYDYRDGYRIPAKEHTNPAGVPSDQIQLGASIAKQHLGEAVGGLDLKVKPAIDTFGAAYTPAQLASETADAKRSGRWTTNSDESGLWLVYGGQVVRKPDGQPLSLTWKQLADLSQSRPGEGTAGAGGMAVPP